MAIQSGAFSGSAITINNAGAFIPQYWLDEVRRERDANFVMAQSTKVIPARGRKGDTFRIPFISRLAVFDKIAEQPVTLQSRTEEQFEIKVDKHREVSFMLEDVVNVQSKYNLQSDYTREAGYALARDIDNSILAERAAIQNFPNQVIYNTDSGLATGAAAALNKSAILQAKTTLALANVPLQECVMVINPVQYADLLQIQDFVSSDYVNGKPNVTGVIGTLYGMEVRTSTNVTRNTLDGYVNGKDAAPQPTPGVTGSPYFPTQGTGVTLPTDAHSNSAQVGNYITAMIYHPEAFAVAMQLDPKVESSRETLYLGDAVVTSQIYGVKTYREDHAVLIHTA